MFSIILPFFHQLICTLQYDVVSTGKQGRLYGTCCLHHEGQNIIKLFSLSINCSLRLYLYMPCRHTRELGVYPYPYSTLTLEGGWWYSPHFGDFNSRKEIQYSWLGFEVSLDRYESLVPTGVQTPVRPACSESLYRLHYLGHLPKKFINHQQQCFSTFVRPRTGKFFFYKTRAQSQQIYS